MAADSLEPFLAHFSLSARVFYSGRLCGVSSDHESETAGHLHVLRAGRLRVERTPGKPLIIAEPSALFYPRPCRHRFRASERDGAEIVCASIEFGAATRNPLLCTLPELVVVPLRSMPELGPAVELLFAEAFGRQPGRQAAVDRLSEYFLVLLLRTAIQQQLIRGGIISGLADARLARATAAIHNRPEHAWTLDDLAHEARMSRARFAVHFRKIVGVTPFEYLADWRIGVAQALLKRGEPLKVVAPAVGYGSSAALTRVFAQRTGITPTVWLASQH